MKVKSNISKLNLYFILSILAISFFIFNFMKKNERIFEEAYHESQMSILKNTMNVYVREFKLAYEADFNSLYSYIDFEEVVANKNRYIDQWARKKLENPNITWIYMGYDIDNMVITKTWKKPEFYDLRDRSWYQQGIGNPDELIWSKPYVGPTTKKITVTLTKGVRDDEGKVRGVFGVDINLDTLNQALKLVEMPKNNQLILLNETDSVIGYTGPDIILDDYKDSEWYMGMKGYSMGHFRTSSNSYVSYYTSKLSNWKLVSITPEDEVKSYRYDLANSYITLIVLILLIVFATYEIKLYRINKRNKEIIGFLRRLRSTNNFDVENQFKELKTEDYLYGEVYEEMYNLTVKISKLERRLYRDNESGLYNPAYLELNSASWSADDYEVFTIRYKNLEEVIDRYGRSIGELVIKRGALVLKNYLEEKEIGIRYSKDTIGLIILKGSHQRQEQIVEEIRNYKWKISEIEIELDIDTIEL